jgi:hypothetical protein
MTAIRRLAGGTSRILRGITAAGAFTGAHPELVSNTNWPGSATK